MTPSYRWMWGPLLFCEYKCKNVGKVCIHFILILHSTSAYSHNNHSDSESVSPSVMSEFLWAHRQLPARPLCPWDFWGKNTGKWSQESEVTQSRLSLCDPMDCSLPGSSLHGIFQAIVLEWIAISKRNVWKVNDIKLYLILIHLRREWISAFWKYIISLPDKFHFICWTKYIRKGNHMKSFQF